MSRKSNPAVLVTGASTGIGNHLVKYLAERGHTVFAGARAATDLAELGKVTHVIPIKLDVRNTEDINNAVDTVARNGAGLYGLVNNAGLGGLGPVHCWTDEELQDLFNVNVFGPFRMTNAFLPALLQSRGRVVNIGSQGGMITYKYYGPYTMTKHALEAYTDTLNFELEAYGVHASIVQPGGIISNIGTNALPGTLERFKRAQKPFAEEARQIVSALQEPAQATDDQEESETNRKPSSPEIASVAVYDALFSDHPKKRYLVGTKWEGDRIINALMMKLLDENDSPQHNYSPEQLVSMLREHALKRNQ